MTKCNKQYIVVKWQYVIHILQYIAIRFWHIVTALANTVHITAIYSELPQLCRYITAKFDSNYGQYHCNYSDITA